MTPARSKQAQIALSSGLARALAAELVRRVPRISPYPGELTVAGALRTARADVSEPHQLDGLRLAIEIKPINLAVGRAMWNRFGDIRAFAVNIPSEDRASESESDEDVDEGHERSKHWLRREPMCIRRRRSCIRLCPPWIQSTAGMVSLISSPMLTMYGSRIKRLLRLVHLPWSNHPWASAQGQCA